MIDHMLTTVTPGSWAELLDVLYSDSWDDRIGRNRSSWAYRGVTNWRWGLQTSLQRTGPHYRTIERHLLRNFRKYAHGFMPDLPSAWHWMTVGQHHGLPTRLLDWTWSPLVGLHFATDQYPPQQKAVVWRINVEDCHARCPDPLRRAMDQEGSMVFTVETLANATQPGASSASPAATLWSEVERFDQLFSGPGVVFLEPESIDQRVVNQYGLFSVTPSAYDDLDAYVQHPNVRVERIVLKRKLVSTVRDFLDGSNINERVIYPGPDGLAAWLKRHYQHV